MGLSTRTLCRMAEMLTREFGLPFQVDNREIMSGRDPGLMISNKGRSIKISIDADYIPNKTMLIKLVRPLVS